MASRRTFLRTSGTLVAGSALARCAGLATPLGDVSEPGDPLAISLPMPTPAQRRWQDAELGVIFHLDLPVVAGDRTPNNAARTTFDPRLYDPESLDTDQWIETAKSAGAKYAIFTATHFSGFMQWQSGLYPYGCRQAAWKGGKGDVVSDFVASCRKYDVLPGLYLSTHRNVYQGVWDHYVDWGRGRGTEAQAAYNRIAEAQTEELCSRYGDLVQIWFDAGARTPSEGGPDVLPIFERHQPESVFYHSAKRSDHRWIGNEEGHAGYPCWATMPGPESGGLSHNSPTWWPLLANGDPGGTVWSPAMVDVVLRGQGAHSWFWRPGEEEALHEVDTLMRMYYESVGRNCNLVIGVVIDDRGLVPEPDRKRLEEFGSTVRRTFRRPLAETGGSGDHLEMEVWEGHRIGHIVVMENIEYGERIRRFRIDYLLPGGRWRPLVGGASIGHKWIWPTDSLVTPRIRLVVEDQQAVPVVRSMAAYGT